MKKKFAAVLLSTVLMLSFVAIADASTQPGFLTPDEPVITVESDLDYLDVMVAAHYFLSADQAERNLWPGNPETQILIPLYTPSREICAFYLKFSTGEYAVINNNKENPAAIEFGVGGNYLIEEILAGNEDAKVIYNNPGDVSVLADTVAYEVKTIETPADVYTYYSDLKVANTELSGIITSQRELVETLSENFVVLQGNSDYGFLYGSELVSTGYYGNNLNNATLGINLNNITWADMSDYTNYYGATITNHCAATCITNMAQYYAAVGYDNVDNSSVHVTFYEVYPIVGNGPIAPATFDADAKSYFSQQGYTLEDEGCGSFEGIKTAIAAGDPCAILLSSALNDWHWVLCVGWREYSQYDQYMQIINGWEDNCDIYYKPYSGSTWMSGTRYWIE